MLVVSPGQTAETYVSEVINLHQFLIAHLHQLPYRHANRHLIRALNRLICRFDGSYPRGC